MDRKTSGEQRDSTLTDVRGSKQIAGKPFTNPNPMPKPVKAKPGGQVTDRPSMNETSRSKTPFEFKMLTMKQDLPLRSKSRVAESSLSPSSLHK